MKTSLPSVRDPCRLRPFFFFFFFCAPIETIKQAAKQLNMSARPRLLVGLFRPALPRKNNLMGQGTLLLSPITTTTGGVESRKRQQFFFRSGSDHGRCPVASFWARKQRRSVLRFPGRPLSLDPEAPIRSWGHRE